MRKTKKNYVLGMHIKWAYTQHFLKMMTTKIILNKNINIM